jgi:hypothetical protein
MPEDGFWGASGGFIRPGATSNGATRLLTIPCATFARRSGDADWECSGGREVERVEVDVWHASVEADCLVCE